MVPSFVAPAESRGPGCDRATARASWMPAFAGTTGGYASVSSARTAPARS